MTEGLSRPVAEAIRFGPFCLLPVQRVLLENDEQIRLGHRAHDILLLLVERAGEFVSNDEIFRRVWPKTVIVEGNLRVHIAGLRKALGDGRGGQRYIVNVPNRGYSFVGVISRGTALTGAPEAAPRKATTGVPAPLHRIIGRDNAIRALSDQLRRHRLVTLVGAGGIGKTTVAVTVARATADEAQQGGWTGVHFVDLAPLSDARLVPSALAATLGLASVVDDAMPNLLAFLHDKSVLVLLDNCEHVVSAVAEMAEAILRGAPEVRILATSREPLRADGEWIQRLQALDLPASSSPALAHEAMAFGAIELFVERASSMLDTFVFLDSDVPAVTDICRRLDGIPLAIELAAARVDSLGVRGIASALDDCFALLSKGRRTALPRHQTLRATMDWSYGLLSARDQTILLRLSVFAGSFSVESAGAVAGWGGLTAPDVLEGVADLTAKSLVVADVSGEDAYFRLLDTTRAYATQRLRMSADSLEMPRRHAEHCLDLLRNAEMAWRSAPTADWLNRYARHTDDVRAALRWAFSAGGDIGLGIDVTVKSAPLFFQLSLAEEHRAHAERALEVMNLAGSTDSQLEFELNIVYGHVLFHTRGIHSASRTAFERALAIAETTGDPKQLALAYSTNWMGAYTRGEPALMLAYAQKFEALIAKESDPALTLLCDRMKSPTLHFLGDQRAARICSETSLASPVVVRSSFLSGAQIDRRVSMGTILGRVLWLQGLPEQAEEVASRTIEVALREGESVALAFTLSMCAVPLALWSGWLEVARERLDMLRRQTIHHSLLAWHNFALAYEPLLTWHEQGAIGEPSHAALLDQAHTPPYLFELLASLHASYAEEAVFHRGETGDAGWCQAELLRVQGERVLRASPDAAEEFFVRSLKLAQRDGTLAWELRTSVSLARLWSQARREQEAIDRLGAALSQVTEGFSMPDVRTAVALYGSIGATSRTLRTRPLPNHDRLLEQKPDSQSSMRPAEPSPK